MLNKLPQYFGVRRRPSDASGDADARYTGVARLLTVDGTGGVDHYRVYVDTADNGTGDLVVTALPLSDVFSTLTRLLLLELLISGGVTLVLAVAAWTIVRQSLRPLVRMGETARSISGAGLGQRVSPATERTEVGRLGLALNSMLGQLEAAFAARAASEQRLRHFVADASHELRTPLTSMRGYAELFRRNPDMARADVLVSMQRIEQEAQRMGVLVEELLLLARLDQGRPPVREEVPLDALVTDACADARVADPGARSARRWSTRWWWVATRRVSARWSATCVRNALVHTPNESPIEVELRREGSSAVLKVIDHGPGIPEDQRERIFERFHRADPMRSRDQGGSGLGLGIAAAVVESHGGRVEVETTPGGGATFIVHLPIAEEPSGRLALSRRVTLCAGGRPVATGAGRQGRLAAASHPRSAARGEDRRSHSSTRWCGAD